MSLCCMLEALHLGVHCGTKVCNLPVLRTVRVVIQPESSGWKPLCSSVMVHVRKFMSLCCMLVALMFLSHGT